MCICCIDLCKLPGKLVRLTCGIKIMLFGVLCFHVLLVFMFFFFLPSPLRFVDDPYIYVSCV